MQYGPKPLVVIDSNVWISGLVFGDNPEKVVRRFIDGQVIVVAAEELFSELRRKIVQRFPLFEPSLSLLEASIREDAILVQLGTVQISVSRD
jgi:putative PIN family toxin of toxin-antitoxin system